MSEETGPKPTEVFSVNIIMDYQNGTISVIPSETASIADILFTLSEAYKAVVVTGQQMLDKPEGQMLQ